MFSERLLCVLPLEAASYNMETVKVLIEITDIGQLDGKDACLTKFVKKNRPVCLNLIHSYTKTQQIHFYTSVLSSLKCFFNPIKG